MEIKRLASIFRGLSFGKKRSAKTKDWERLGYNCIVDIIDGHENKQSHYQVSKYLGPNEISSYRGEAFILRHLGSKI